MKMFSVTYYYLQLFCILLQSGYWCFMYLFTFQISLVFALFTSLRPALIFGTVDFGCSLDNSFDFKFIIQINISFLAVFVPFLDF